MKKLTLLFASFFFATLALAQTTAPAFAQIEEMEIHVEEVGFDQALTLVILNSDQPSLEVELRDKAGHLVYASSLTVQNQVVWEIDLSDLSAGSYTLVLTDGINSQVQSLIMP